MKLLASLLLCLMLIGCSTNYYPTFGGFDGRLQDTLQFLYEVEGTRHIVCKFHNVVRYTVNQNTYHVYFRMSDMESVDDVIIQYWYGDVTWAERE